MKTLIVANWKMNPITYSQAQKLAVSVLEFASKLKKVETVLCPPFLWLPNLISNFEFRISNFSFGAQDVFWEEKGAFTGEISALMLKNLGISYVIIGHSERRRHLGETDEMINKKVKAAIRAGLKVILCVGETLQEHRRGQTKSVIRRQLKQALRSVSKFGLRNSDFRNHVVIAYEPVWAIGTGLPETPQNANMQANFIKKEVGDGIRVLYGGSVNAKNIDSYLAMPFINGALVGGASLNAKEFKRILEIAERL